MTHRVTFLVCDTNTVKIERTLIVDGEIAGSDLVLAAKSIGFDDAVQSAVAPPLFDLWLIGDSRSDEVYMFKTKSEVEGLLSDTEKTAEVLEFLSRKDTKVDRLTTETFELKVTKDI